MGKSETHYVNFFSDYVLYGEEYVSLCVEGKL